MPKKNDVSVKYQKMSHTEHVLAKPDSYIGSIELEDTDQYVLNDADASDIKIEKKKFQFCPGFYKCFDELIVNAFDHWKRQQILNKTEDNIRQVDNIKVEITDSEIIVMNDGDGIDIEIIPKYKKYPVELIFGTLLTSTNYDDTQKREWGGRNGYGAKLANIFSLEMTIETVDANRKKKYIQTFSNNMKNKTTPKITNYSKSPYTKITWRPDFKRFNMTTIDHDHMSLLKKRVYDIGACTDQFVHVWLNKKKLPYKKFVKYASFYIKDKPFACYKENKWTVIATYNDTEEFEQVSFVNGINTTRGGKHVDYITNQIKDKLVKLIEKKHKKKVKGAYIKNQLMIFVNSTVINPSFDGQTKETLKTNKQNFGYSVTIPKEFIQKLFKTEITERILRQTAYKDNKDLEKTDGKKKARINVPKLCDANWAGTKKSKDCTLILTEGDSAKTMAIAGLSVVGRDAYGVFPLKGKILNVRDASINDISNNKELCSIKKILGLQSGHEYTLEELNTNWPLRYGKILIMTDQDHDGSHIKGLVINVFDHLWPQLLNNHFISSMLTPIIKATKGKRSNSFYTIQEYEVWKKTVDKKGWKIKYYKGLGTSTTKEAKEYFRDLKIVNYCHSDEGVIATEQTEGFIQINKNKEKCKIDLAFNKKRADDRKQWLNLYNRDLILDNTQTEVTFNEFIDKELIHFSNASNDRSIPDIRDGFKPSIRKIIFSCFKRNLVHEIKVAQLAGYVSENAAYHHGEKSLEGAIVGLAHDFIGSNNLNLLKPIGQFGSRLHGGKDCAQSRYIYTQLSTLTRKMFNVNDDYIYTYLDDDGQKIEPEAYCPILPMVLINGSEGIGTGFSSKIPRYNPNDLATFIKNKLNGVTNENNIVIQPWYRGLKGTIEKTSSTSYISKGQYRFINHSTIEITELPVGVWTEKYVEWLHKVSSVKKNKTLKYYTDYSTESQVSIKLEFDQYKLADLHSQATVNGITGIEKFLKLTKSINTTNMWLFNTKRKIVKYNNVNAIIEEWFHYRYKTYEQRKVYLLAKLKHELNLIFYKVKFINEFIQDTIDIRNKTKQSIMDLLEEKEYPKLNIHINMDTIRANTATVNTATVNTDTVNTATVNTATVNPHHTNYDYILKMNLYTLTKEEIESLTNKRDNKQIEFDTLTAQTIKKMWMTEINECIKLYNKINTQKNKKHNPIKKTNNISKKDSTKGSKKGTKKGTKKGSKKGTKKGTKK